MGDTAMRLEIVKPGIAREENSALKNGPAMVVAMPSGTTTRKCEVLQWALDLRYDRSS
jgi:hypothetical protein